MPLAREQRRLAAILFADGVGSSLLMGRDESSIVARLLQHLNQRLAPAVGRRGGRVIRLKGDGALVEFASAVDALAAAIEFQQAMIEANRGQPDDQAIVFRIGLHLGDVIVEGDDIYGDAVNVAARLEAEAPAGGIIVSRAVREAVTGRLKVSLQSQGELALKNIERPIRAFRAEWSAEDWPAQSVASQAVASPDEPTPALTLPDKPSIAVLPFQNMSGDAEQEYFADGIVEDIITALSRFNSLFVIARNSSFTYKGRAVDVKQVGRELGVRYVLEGSVRKSGNRVRITGQLVDATTGAHLWAERFDGALEDIFDLQDRVTANVVGAIMPKLEQAEIERAKRKPTESLDAYDCFLRGMANIHQWTKESFSQALELFYRAINLDNDFASAYGAAAWCYVQRKSRGWRSDSAEEIAEAGRLARRAIELGKEDAFALRSGGYALVYVLGALDEGSAFINRALVLNPNWAPAWATSGWARVWLGEPEVAIQHFAQAMRLSPLDPLMPLMLAGTALGHFIAGRYDEASSLAENALRDQPTFLQAIRTAAASKALAGRLDEARMASAPLRHLDPTLRISNLKDVAPFRRPDDLAKYAEGLR